MDYIPDLGSDGSDNSEFFAFGLGIVIGIGSESFFFSLSLHRKAARAVSSALSVVFTLSFSLPFASFCFFFLSASRSLSGLHGRSGRVGSAFQVPPFSYVRSYVSHSSSREMRHLGSQDRFSMDQIRSDQSVSQSIKGKKTIQNNNLLFFFFSQWFPIQVRIDE
jgi:hypothetical protein